MTLENLVIPLSEALRDPRYHLLHERLRELSRIRQARKNVFRARQQLALAIQVYRNEQRPRSGSRMPRMKAEGWEEKRQRLLRKAKAEGL